MKSMVLIIGLVFILAGCATGSQPTMEQLAKEHFTECPSNYQLQIHQKLSGDLNDPYGAEYSYSLPEKYVYQGNFGHKVFASVYAKARFGVYGKETHMFFCFQDGTVEEINEVLMDMATRINYNRQ